MAATASVRDVVLANPHLSIREVRSLVESTLGRRVSPSLVAFHRESPNARRVVVDRSMPIAA